MIKEDNSLFCNRCYHTWNKRRETPKYCPKCKSPYWNKDRKRKIAMKKLVILLKEQIIGYHDLIIDKTGGEKGVRDEGGVHNAVFKLLTNSYKNRKEPTKIGAFILDDFAKNHYFMDGNKRTAYFTSKVFMLINGCHLKTNYDDALGFILEVAKYGSRVTREQIKEWLDKKCEPIDRDKTDIKEYLKDVLLEMVVEGREKWKN